MTSMVVQVSASGPSSTSCPNMEQTETLNINISSPQRRYICSPKSLTHGADLDDDDDSETTMSASLESDSKSDSSALAMLKNQFREVDTILHDVLDVNIPTTTTTSNSQNYEYDDEMKQELCTLSFQEKMLKQEMDMIDIVISQSTSAATATHNDESSQPMRKEQFEIKEQQDGEMEDLDWQLELEKEFEEEEQQQQQQPHYEHEHEHPTIIRKELTQDTYEGGGGYRYNTNTEEEQQQQQQQQQPHYEHEHECENPTIIRKELTQETYEGGDGYQYNTNIEEEEAEMDTNMNESTQPQGCGAPSLCEVCYDGVFGVEIMLVVSKSISQFLAVPARPEIDVAIVSIDETRQEVAPHDKEEPVRGGESSRERADSFHSEDGDAPTLDTACSKSDGPVNEEEQDHQCMEDERDALHIRLGVLRSESEDTEENDEETFQRYSEFLPSLDHVISDIATSGIFEPEDPLSPLSACSVVCSEAAYTYLCSALQHDIPITTPDRTMKNITIEGIHSQLGGGSLSKDLLLNSQSQCTDDGKDRSIITNDDRDESIITLQICRSDDKSGGGGDGSRSMKMKAQLNIGSSSETSRSQSMDEKYNGYLTTSIGRGAGRSMEEQQRSIMDHKHSQSFDKVCRSQSTDESDEEAKDTTTIATDSIGTTDIGIDTDYDGKDGDGAVLSCSFSAENQSSFANSQSVVVQGEERREQEESSRFAYNICACVGNIISNEIIDTIKPFGGNDNNIKSKKRMETVKENPTAEACISLGNSQVWESCIEETVNSKIRSHGSNKPPTEVDATSTPENISINLSLEKEAMKLINLAIDDLVIDDNAIGLDEIGQAYTEESQTEASALDHAMKAVESPIPMLSQLDPGISVIKSKAYIREEYITTPKAGHRISALEYELQFSESLLGSSSQLGTFDTSEQVSEQMNPSPSPSNVGTFDASEQLSELLAATQPPGERIEEARRGKPASLTALEYEMQFSEDDMQLCSPTDEASFMRDAYDADPKEIMYRESVKEGSTGSMWDLASQEEVESNENYVFSEAPLETPTSEDSVDIPMIVRNNSYPKIEVGTLQPIVLPTRPSEEACTSKYKTVVSFEAADDPLETPTSEDSVDIPMIVRHKPDPNIEVGTLQPIVVPTPPSGEACKSKYKDVVSFEAVDDPLETPTSEHSVDIPMTVRHKPDPKIEVGTLQPIVPSTPPSGEACESKRKEAMSFEAVEDVPSDEGSILPRYGSSESDLGAPSDEMKSEKSACGSRSFTRTDNSYCSEQNNYEDDLDVLDVLEAKTNEMEVISTVAVNRFGSSSKAIGESVSNESSVEVSVESDGDTVITRVTNDAVDTKEPSSGDSNQAEGGNAIAESVSNEISVEVYVESDDDTVITRVQSRCEVINDVVDTKELASTGEAYQSEGGKFSENYRETDFVINSSMGDNGAASPEGNGSRDPLDHFPSLKEALSAQSTGKRKKEVRYVKEARSPLKFLFGYPEDTSATESDNDAPVEGNPGVSEVATVPEDTVGSTEARYLSRLNRFVTSVTCCTFGDLEVEVQAAEPNMEMVGQHDSNETSERSQINDVRDNVGRQPSAQKDEQDQSGILNAMPYRSYMESVREVKRELASSTGKARLVFETEEEREIEAVLSDKLWLLGESVSVASSTNSAFGSTTLPNDVRDDDGLDIRSWDKQARELLQQNELLLQSMANFDFACYQKCVADDMTGIDAGSKGQSTKREEFHQYCFDSSRHEKDPVTVSIVAPNIRFLSPDAAITSYTRIDQLIRDGKPEMIQTSETRVWQKRGERWVNCHFHQS